MGSLAGRLSVADGDMIEIHGQRICLHSIDAPGSGQTCQGVRGRDYRCGQRAARALSDLIGSRPVRGKQTDTDQYGRIVTVRCVGGQDIYRWMVGQSQALADRNHGTEYVADEDAARVDKRRMRMGSFFTRRAGDKACACQGGSLDTGS